MLYTVVYCCYSEVEEKAERVEVESLLKSWKEVAGADLAVHPLVVQGLSQVEVACRRKHSQAAQADSG